MSRETNSFIGMHREFRIRAAGKKSPRNKSYQQASRSPWAPTSTRTASSSWLSSQRGRRERHNAEPQGQFRPPVKLLTQHFPLSILHGQRRLGVGQRQAIAFLIDREQDVAFPHELIIAHAHVGDEAAASHKQATAARDVAALNLQRTEVKAPVNGFVTNFSLAPGVYASEGEKAFSP